MKTCLEQRNIPSLGWSKCLKIQSRSIGFENCYERKTTISFRRPKTIGQGHLRRSASSVTFLGNTVVPKPVSELHDFSATTAEFVGLVLAKRIFGCSHPLLGKEPHG